MSLQDEIEFFCLKTTVLQKNFFIQQTSEAQLTARCARSTCWISRLQILYRDTSFFRISSRKKLYWLTPTFSDFVVTFYCFPFFATLVSIVTLVVSLLGTETFDYARGWEQIDVRNLSSWQLFSIVGDRSGHLGTLFRFFWVVTLPMAWDPSPGCPAAVFNQRKRVLADHARRESRQ